MENRSKKEASGMTLEACVVCTVTSEEMKNKTERSKFNENERVRP